MRMRDWSSDVCSSDLVGHGDGRVGGADVGGEHEPGARVEGELRRRPTAGGDGLGDRGDEPNAHELIDAGGDRGSGEAGGLGQFRAGAGYAIPQKLEEFCHARDVCRRIHARSRHISLYRRRIRPSPRLSSTKVAGVRGCRRYERPAGRAKRCCSRTAMTMMTPFATFCTDDDRLFWTNTFVSVWTMRTPKTVPVKIGGASWRG